MSPFLTTLGGGSVRGFGRGRKITAAVVVPQVPTITNLTFSYSGGATSMSTSIISFTIPASGPYQIQYQLSDSAATGLSALPVTTSHTRDINGAFYREACTTISIRARLYNTSTATYLEWGNYYTTGVSAVPAGTVTATGCEGCNAVTYTSNGTCSGTTNGTTTSTVYNSISCCPLELSGYCTLNASTSTFGLSGPSGIPPFSGYWLLYTAEGGCGNGSLVGVTLPSYNYNINPNSFKCAGPGYYYAVFEGCIYSGGGEQCFSYTSDVVYLS